MMIVFPVGGRLATFRRDSMTGRAAIEVDGHVSTLASPFNPRTHFQLGTKRTWRRRIGDHDVLVTHRRPVLVAGLRESSYVIAVDGQEVASATGV